ncbi:MAG TPA: TetR/AcrR family transcriptional regulator [Acidimicrobiales bacterium]
MPKVSDEHKARVRQRLLDAAHECLLEKGMEGLTTRNVLERAGVSAGTLYHYFSGKDDLVMALADRVAEVEFVNIEPETDLLALVGRLLQPDGTYSVLPELRVRARVDEDVRRALSHYDQLTITRFIPLVEQSQRDGLIDPEVDAAALVELVELVFEAVHAHVEARTYVTSHARVVNTFLHILSSLQPQGAPL